jgi:hypothetical protein
MRHPLGAIFLLGLGFAFVGMWVDMGMLREVAYNVDTNWGPEIQQIASDGGSIWAFAGLFFDVLWWLFWNVIIHKFGFFEKLGATVKFGSQMTPAGLLYRSLGSGRHSI